MNSEIESNGDHLSSLVDFGNPATVVERPMREAKEQKVAFMVVQDEQNLKRLLGQLNGRGAGGPVNFRFETEEKIGDSADLFFKKLVGTALDPELLSHQTEAEVLGYDFSFKQLAVAIYLDGFKENCLEAEGVPTFERQEIIRLWKKRIESAFNSFFTRKTRLTTAYLGDSKFLVIKNVSDGEEHITVDRLKRSFKAIFQPLRNNQIKNISVGFGNPYENFKGLTDTCREAFSALNLGIKLGQSNRSYYIDDFGIMSTLAEGDLEKKASMAKRILNKIADNNLIRTLTSFLNNNLNITDTALDLGIHRNTAIYRLEQISDRLGLDPRNFDEAVKIKMALYIRDLAA